MAPHKPLPTADLDEVLLHAQHAFEHLRGARIFLTGGTGFFGHWLLESLLRANRERGLNVQVTVLTRDAARFRARSPHITGDPGVTLLEGDIRSFHYPTQTHSHVLHAATDTGAARAGAPAYELAESILEGTRHTVRFALATGARRMLYVSSGAVYGRNVVAVDRIGEEFRGAPDPLALSSGYDEAKRMAEYLCVAYSAGTALECTVARAFAFVGPHLPLDTHFAIGNFIGNAMAGEALAIAGDGTPRRSFLYMTDLAAWLWTLLDVGRPNAACNVGSDEAVSIGELAHRVANALRPGLTVTVAQPPVPNAIAAGYVPDITRARESYGLRVTVPLDEAIRRTAAWHGFVPQA